MEAGGGASRGIGGKGHGKVAPAEDELEEVVASLGGPSEDVVLGELHHVDVRNGVREIAAAELRAL